MPEIGACGIEQASKSLQLARLAWKRKIALMPPYTAASTIALVSYTSDGYILAINQYADLQTAEEAAQRLASKPEAPPFELLEMLPEDFSTLYEQSISSGVRFYGERADVSPLQPGLVPPVCFGIQPPTGQVTRKASCFDEITDYEREEWGNFLWATSDGESATRESTPHSVI